jgi:site-specific DNA-cytosine methylase
MYVILGGMSKLTVLDIFSGIGGFTHGLQKAGNFTPVAFCEIEKPCQRVLNKHWPDVPIIDDVKSINKNTFTEPVDVICGGFPCQDISIGGKGVGIKGERSGLWFEFARIIGELRPKYAIIENVSALRNRGLNHVLGQLAEIGYDATYTMLDTKYCGAPQRRRRMYILAVRDGIPSESDPFQLEKRSQKSHKLAVESFAKGFAGNFAEGEGVEQAFTFLTRQRSDEFAETGLSGTLAKRDYKSFTDLVVTQNAIRRVHPIERLRLQGFPDDWYDDCDLTISEQFTYNGMSTDAVAWVGKRLLEFDNERV